LERLVSKGFESASGNEASSSDWPENIAYQYLSLMVPKIVISNPGVTVTSQGQVAESMLEEAQQELSMYVEAGAMDPQEAEEMYMDLSEHNRTAQGMQAGVRRFIDDPIGDYGTKLDRVCYDFLTTHGILMHKLITMPGSNPNDPNAPRWVAASRISPRRFVIDPYALHYEEARWASHWEVVDNEDLNKMADSGKGWNKEAIKELSADGDDTAENYPNSPNTTTNRKQVRVYQAWVPEYRENDWPGGDEGYNGAVFEFDCIHSYTPCPVAPAFLTATIITFSSSSSVRSSFVNV